MNDKCHYTGLTVQRSFQNGCGKNYNTGIYLTYSLIFKKNFMFKQYLLKCELLRFSSIIINWSWPRFILNLFCNILVKMVLYRKINLDSLLVLIVVNINIQRPPKNTRSGDRITRWYFFFLFSIQKKSDSVDDGHPLVG